MKLLICAQVMDSTHPILGFFHTWVEAFAEKFDEVHVICLQKGKCTLPPHVFVHTLGKESGESNIKYLYRFYKTFTYIFFSVHVDFVFFHMGAIFNILAAPFFLVRKLMDTKFYWWKAHGHINAMGKFALLFVDRVYTSTESGFAITTKKRHVVGQAIDVTLFVFPDTTSSRKNEIIYVGRIMPVKRIEDFLVVAKQLYAKDSTLSFTLVGPVGDDAYFALLKEKCLADGLDSYVHFVGSKTQQELVVLYQKARIFLNTLLTHSMDKTVLEAMLCGCIPVTGNKAFATLLASDALYVPQADIETYTRTIARVLKEDVTLLQKRLHDAVIQQHSLNTFSQRIFDI